MIQLALSLEETANNRREIQDFEVFTLVDLI
jgi:hypothetical protein